MEKYLQRSRMGIYLLTLARSSIKKKKKNFFFCLFWPTRLLLWIFQFFFVEMKDKRLRTYSSKVLSKDGIDRLRDLIHIQHMNDRPINRNHLKTNNLAASDDETI